MALTFVLRKLSIKSCVMEAGKNIIVRIIKQFFLFIIFTVLFVGIIGAFIYGLYRITVFNKTIYSYLIALVIGGACIYFVFRTISKKIFTRVILKLLRFFYTLVLFLFFLSLIMLYGAFFVRYMRIGIIITPFLIGLIIYAAAKWDIFSWVKYVYKRLAPDGF